MKLWSEEVAQARALIESVVKEIDPGLECDADGHRGIYNDTVDVVLRKGALQAFAVVTIEAWINARTDPQQMKEAFDKVIGKLKSDPDTVFLITSAGLRETTLETGWKALEETEGWQWFEDEAALVEADRIADRFLKGTKPGA
ncbi:MAG: hypothetical protein HYX93_03550 [Chloroflexi bacterium]|nr:hypothetical protein [Chloroflexota bacterium]